MRDRRMWRRQVRLIALMALGMLGSVAYAAELEVPATAATVRYDFEDGRLGDWKIVDGQWAIEEMAGAPSGNRVLVQRAAENAFNVIVAPAGPYRAVDVSMRFKPMSGREDASGGIVFRFHDGKYYVIRANALENNFNLYYYDRGCREITGVRVPAPALGQWHTVRVVAVGDHIQGYSAARSCSTTATAGYGRARWASGPRPTR